MYAYNKDNNRCRYVRVNKQIKKIYSNYLNDLNV